MTCVSLLGRVCAIQQQLAQLESESWPGLAEADKDRQQLVTEKEALLQELLQAPQRQPPEAQGRLQDERRRLEDEIQRARVAAMQSTPERYVCTL